MKKFLTVLLTLFAWIRSDTKHLERSILSVMYLNVAISRLVDPFSKSKGSISWTHALYLFLWGFFNSIRFVEILNSKWLSQLCLRSRARSTFTMTTFAAKALPFKHEKISFTHLSISSLISVILAEKQY